MEINVIGLFEAHVKAEEAVQELLLRGCPRDSVRIEDGESIACRMQTMSSADKAADLDGGLMAKIVNFFENIGIVGPDGPLPGKLNRLLGAKGEDCAFRPGEVLVVVEVEGHLIDTAVEILKKHGAVETATRRLPEKTVFTNENRVETIREAKRKAS